jgi:hypothetical protein
MNTSSSSRVPSQTETPHLMVTRSPITTSFSTKQRSQMLQPLPIVAPGSTLQKAQIRVPSPMRSVATSAVGWIEIMNLPLA